MSKETAPRESGNSFAIVYALTALAAALRLFELGRQSIWGDESLTLFKYTWGNSFTQVWEHVWLFATHPPLYFEMAHFWYQLGKSEFMLRFPSAVCGIATVPLVYALANRLFGRTTAWIAALVVVFSPIHIWYSQEARMYSLQVLLSVCAVLFYTRARQEHRKADALGYAISGILGLYTQMATVFLLAAIGVHAVMSSLHNPRRAAAWMAVHALIFAAFMPWMLNVRHSRQTAKKGLTIGYQRPKSVMDIGYGFYTFSVGFSLGPTVAELHQIPPTHSIKEHLPEIALSGIVFALLLLIGIKYARKIDRSAARLMLALLILPSGLATMVALMPGFPLNPRYMLVAIVPYWILLALGLQAAYSSRRWRPAIPVAVILIGFSLFNHYFSAQYSKQDMRSAISLVNKEARTGDVVVISSVELGGPFLYYFQRHDVPFFGYPPSTGAVQPESLPKDMPKLLSGKKKAWLVLGRTWSSDPKGLIPGYFDRSSHLVQKRLCSGVSVLCYDLSSLRSPTSKHTHAF